MKFCENCKVEYDDAMQFCKNCGQPLVQKVDENTKADAQESYVNVNNAQQEQQQYQQYATPQYGPYQQYVVPNPYDHTNEFDAADISENKVICMLLYLLGIPGIIIALLSQQDSPYVKFHLRWALRFLVVNILLVLLGVLLVWTFIVPIAAGVCAVIVFVLKVIAFFQICSGKAKDPAIIRSLGFLK